MLRHLFWGHFLSRFSQETSWMGSGRGAEAGVEKQALAWEKLPGQRTEMFPFLVATSWVMWQGQMPGLVQPRATWRATWQFDVSSGRKFICMSIKSDQTREKNCNSVWSCEVECSELWEESSYNLQASLLSTAWHSVKDIFFFFFSKDFYKWIDVWLNQTLDCAASFPCLLTVGAVEQF